jgi:antitoxin component YwqK of YwqJK toxin-antitoxin module
VLEGASERFHVNGKPSERGSYRDGRRDGAWMSFFDTGNKQEETHYENGLRHGTDLAYYPSGKLKTQSTYVSGKVQDARRSYFEEGPVKTARTGENEPELIYFLDGTISREEPRRGGRLHGRLLSYDEQGRPDWQCDYVDGVKQGVETFWRDGKVETTHLLCGVPASKLGPREQKALAARFNKKGDRYEKLDVLSEVTEGLELALKPPRRTWRRP